MSYEIGSEAKQFFSDNSYLKISGYLSEAEISQLNAHIEDMVKADKQDASYIKYHEKRNNRRLLWRIGNCLGTHPELQKVFSEKGIADLVSYLCGEKVSIFKDKIHFKYPGSSGFPPHQDGPAYKKFGTYFVTIMLALEDCDVENGCLYIDSHWAGKREFLPLDKSGSIAGAVADEIAWVPLECDAGDVLIFDSYIPHYSRENNSAKSRKTFFITYGLESEECSYDEYHQRLHRMNNDNKPFEYGFLNSKTASLES